MNFLFRIGVLSLLFYTSCSKSNTTAFISKSTLSAKINGEIFSASPQSIFAQQSNGSLNIGTGYGFLGIDRRNNLGELSIYVEPVEAIGLYDVDLNSQSIATRRDLDQRTWWNPQNTPFNVNFTEINDSRITGTFSGYFLNELDSLVEVTEGEFNLELN